MAEAYEKKKKEKKDRIGLMGHLDVVPEGTGWLYPPYDGIDFTDFIGRGYDVRVIGKIIGFGDFADMGGQHMDGLRNSGAHNTGDNQPGAYSSDQDNAEQVKDIQVIPGKQGFVTEYAQINPELRDTAGRQFIFPSACLQGDAVCQIGKLPVKISGRSKRGIKYAPVFVCDENLLQILVRGQRAFQKLRFDFHIKIITVGNGKRVQAGQDDGILIG